MAHRKHHRGMKHVSGSAASKTLKRRQLQIREELKRKGYAECDLPFPGTLAKHKPKRSLLDRIIR